MSNGASTHASPILSPSPTNPWVVGITNKLEWRNATWNETWSTPAYPVGSPFNVSFFSWDGHYRNGTRCDPCQPLNEEGGYHSSFFGSLDSTIQGIDGSIGVTLPKDCTAGSYSMQWSYQVPENSATFFFADQNFTILASYDSTPKVVKAESVLSYSPGSEVQGIEGSVGVTLPKDVAAGDYKMQWSYTIPSEGVIYPFAFQNFSILALDYENAPKVIEAHSNSDTGTDSDSALTYKASKLILGGLTALSILKAVL